MGNDDDDKYESVVDFSRDSPTRGMLFPPEVAGKIVKMRPAPRGHHRLETLAAARRPTGGRQCKGCQTGKAAWGRLYCQKCSDELIRKERG